MSIDQLRPLQEREYQKIQFDEIKPGDQIRIELNYASLDWPGRPFRFHGVVFTTTRDSTENSGRVYIKKKGLEAFGKPLLMHYEESEIIGIERFQ